MKTTKKLLIILCASALLVATAFSIVMGAMVAGEGTTMNEYLTMKLSEFEDFEDNAKTIFGNSINYTEGKIVSIDSHRKAPSYVYDDEKSLSVKYYLMDYDKNTSAKDGYIQPVLGKLDNIDKTPVNGFVSEFDIAFFTPVEYEMVEKTEQMKDKDGNLLWESDGKGGILKDEAGLDVPMVQVVTKIVYDEKTGEPIMVPAYDEDGFPMEDENGDPVMTPKTEPVMVEKLEYVKDERGKVIFNETGEPLKQKVVKSIGDFTGLDKTLYVNILNTETNKDGMINAVVFKTYAKPANPDDLPSGFDPNYVDTGYIEMYCNTANPNLDTNAPGSYKFLPDEWIHLTFQYDAKSLMMHIFVGTDSDEGGRKLVASVSALDPVVENLNNAESPVYPLRFRLGSSATRGYVGYDNFVAYQGETVRDPDALNKMQPADVIMHYVNILDDSEEKSVLRYQAYLDLKENYMREYKPGSGNTTSLNAAIDTFYKYDNNDDGCRVQLVENVKAENVATFKKYVNDIGNITRGLENTAQREVKANMARDFLDSCGTLIDRDSAEYAEAAKDLKGYQDKIAKDKQANSFIEVMQLYENAINFNASISRIKSHYESALALRDGISDYNDFYIEKAEGEEEPEQSLSYTDLKHATLLFDGDGENVSAGKFVENLILDDNSRRFVNYMSVFSKTTETEWRADDGTLENIWYMALTVKREDGYNTSYPGMGNALGIFDRVHTYFWGSLQAEHVAILTEKLNAFGSADSNYISKAGICTYVSNYLVINAKDIDFDNKEIQSLMERNEAYEEQLGVLMQDYKNLLVQNATKFINTMKLVSLYTNYKDIKPLFDEATEYYYTMDLVGEGIDEYTAQYEKMRSDLASLEAANDTFLAIINGEIVDEEGVVVYKSLSKATTKSDLYRTLNALSEYLDQLDETYEGIREALELYNSKYVEYTGEASVINKQIAKTVEVTLSTRGNWDIDNIISFVKKLFNR